MTDHLPEKAFPAFSSTAKSGASAAHPLRGPVIHGRLSRALLLVAAALAATSLQAQLAPPAPAPQTTQAAPAATETGVVQPIDAVAAIVDDDVILVSELHGAMQRAQLALQRSGREVPPLAQLQRQVFDQLVLESLQLQMADRAGVRITDAELNESIGRIAAQNNMSLEQFSRELSADGISYAVAREQLRRELLLQRVQQGFVSQRVQISDQEIDDFLNSADGQALAAPQYHLMHALVAVPEGSGDAAVAQAQAQAEQIAAQLRGGQSLQTVLAAQTSAQVQGSDLGWRRADGLPSLFAELVPKLNKGEVTSVRSPSGFHVLQLVEIRGQGQVVQQTRARHILLKPSAIRSDEQTAALAEELRQRAQKGSDFSDLARQYSEDIGSAMEGGDLGWTTPGQLVPEFQQAMDETRPGSISAPFQSKYGWHILIVDGRREQDMSDDMRRNMARNFLHQRKFQDELQVWLQKIRNEAYVDIKKS